MPTTTITMKSTKVQTLGGDTRAHKRRSKVEEYQPTQSADEVKHATK